MHPVFFDGCAHIWSLPSPIVEERFHIWSGYPPLVIHSALHQLGTSLALAWSPRQSLVWLLSLTLFACFL